MIIKYVLLQPMVHRRLIKKETLNSSQDLMKQYVRLKCQDLQSIDIEFDANSKVGNKIIPGDHCETPTENGKLLLEILDQHENLVL